MNLTDIQQAIRDLPLNEQIKIATWLSQHVSDHWDKEEHRHQAIRQQHNSRSLKSTAGENEIAFLISQYEEHTEQGRHLETERSTVTNIIGAVAAAILVYMGSTDFHSEYWWTGLTLTILGAYGFVMTRELYSRFLRHMDFAYGFRYALEQQLPASGEASIREVVNSLHSKRLRLHHLWPAFNLLIAVLGIFLAIWIYLHPKR